MMPPLKLRTCNITKGAVHVADDEDTLKAGVVAERKLANADTVLHAKKRDIAFVAPCARGGTPCVQRRARCRSVAA